MNFRTLEEFWAFYMSHQVHEPPGGGTSPGPSLPSSLFFSRSSSAAGYSSSAPLYLATGLPGAATSSSRATSTTFGRPFWSFLCDVKMFWLVLTGQMDREIKRLVF